MPANKTSTTAAATAPARSRRGYRRNMGQCWMLAQAARCFANFVRNWNGTVSDSDVFNLFYAGPYEAPGAFEALLLRHFSPAVLQEYGLLESDPVGEEPPRRRTAASRSLRRRRPRPERSASSITLFDDIPHVLENLWNRKTLRRKCRALLEEGSEAIQSWAARTDRRHADPMEARAAEIVSFLGLDETALDVFTVAAVRAMSDFRDLPILNATPAQRLDFIAMAADRPLGDVSRALRADAPLRRYDVLDSDGDLEHGSFRDYLENGGAGLLEGHFYRRIPVDDALPLAHHGALADAHAPLLTALLSAAPCGRAPSILFYGPPGTGKTSFARTLARELSLDLVEIRMDDGKGHVSPAARLNGLRLCQDRLPAGRTLVLVDEADAILQTNGNLLASLFGAAPTLQKGLLNASLDGARLPILWVANTPAEALDESVRRRFDYSIRFEALDAAKRISIWRNNIDRLGLGTLLPADAVSRLAARYPTNAGGISAALENARRLGAATPDRAEAIVASLLEPHCALLGIATGDSATAPSSGGYSTDGLNIAGPVPPERILAAVRDFHDPACRAADPDRPRLNILLYGPPGTGKTEFVRHLARETAARLDLLTGASLLDPYVGGTEARIRDAFRAARDGHAILFLDELDGLLMDRASARQRWEFTQVNQLLHEMEEAGCIFVGATNCMDRLDPAVLRRFTLKLRFGYLSPEGKRLFYGRMFGDAPLAAAEASRLEAIPNLAPGDFRTVRQSFHWMGGGAPAPTAILDALAAESALKRDTTAARPFGFA